MSEDGESKPKPKLSRLERIVADEFLTGVSAGDAYRRTNRKCTKDQARKRAHNILRKPHVAEYVATGQMDRSKATGIRAEQIARELALLAFGNIKRLYNEDGTLIPVHLLPDDISACLSGVDVEGLYHGSGKDRTQVGDILKFKIASKIDALEKLAKLLGFMTEKVEINNASPPIIQLVGYDDEQTDNPVPAKPAAD